MNPGDRRSRPHPTRRPSGRHDRGTVLLLFPAAVFVLCVLAALAVDSAHATMRRRELQHAADAAANDAAALAIDDAGLRSGVTRLDEDRARRIAIDAVARQGLGGDVRVVDVRVIDGATVVVELEARHPSVFARSIPGAEDEIRVPARATAEAVTAGEGRSDRTP